MFVQALLFQQLGCTKQLNAHQPVIPHPNWKLN
jgi:hypothetical protein